MESKQGGDHDIEGNVCYVSRHQSHSIMWSQVTKDVLPFREIARNRNGYRQVLLAVGASSLCGKRDQIRGLPNTQYLHVRLINHHV